MELLTLSVSAATVMGLAFGAGPCNVTCLPYLGPVLLAEGSSWRTVVPFSAGRLAGYAGLGLAAGAAGRVVTGALTSGPAGWLLGSATVAVGLYLLRRSRGRQCAGPGRERSVRFHRNGGRRLPLGLGLFGMGAAMALNPCAPLGTVLPAAAATASPLAGLSLGAGFGIGAVFVPTLFFAIAMAHFGRQVRECLAHWGNRLEQGAGLLLVVLGTVTTLGLMQP